LKAWISFIRQRPSEIASRKTWKHTGASSTKHTSAEMDEKRSRSNYRTDEVSMSSSKKQTEDISTEFNSSSDFRRSNQVTNATFVTPSAASTTTTTIPVPTTNTTTTTTTTTVVVEEPKQDENFVSLSPQNSPLLDLKSNATQTTTTISNSKESSENPDPVELANTPQTEKKAEEKQHEEKQQEEKEKQEEERIEIQIQKEENIEENIVVDSKNDE